MQQRGNARPLVLAVLHHGGLEDLVLRGVLNTLKDARIVRAPRCSSRHLLRARKMSTILVAELGAAERTLDVDLAHEAWR